MTLNVNHEILSILSENMSRESMWFLYTLIDEKRELHKEELRDLANERYRERAEKYEESLEKKLITSRYGLDIHTARLEGAGLVKVRIVGRVRFYSITELGTILFRFKGREE